MGEFALVAAVVPKLIMLLEGEIQLHGTMRKELLIVKGELENMKAFLIAAENSFEECSLQEQVWVKQVREIAFECEDIVDEFMLHFERDHLNGSSTYLLSMFKSIKNYGAQRDFASRLKDIRSRFTQIHESNQRYPTVNSISCTPSNRWHNPQQDPLFNDVDLMGIEKHKMHLIDMLVVSDISTLKVVSVYGIRGVGKTSLVRKYKD